MDSRRLRYFVQIVDSGSITRAAAAAGVAQPALSQQVAILENELRVRLLDRGASGTTPTPAGRVLYAYAQTILRHYDELRVAVHKEAQPLSGTVILGVSPSMMQRLVLPLIERICPQHPEMHLQVQEGGSALLQDYLSNGRIELSISPTPPNGENMTGHTILNEQLILIYPKSWDSVEGAPLSEIATLPWVLTRQPHSIRSLVDAVFMAANLAPRIIAEIDSLFCVVETVKRGIAIAVMPSGAVRDEIDRGLVCWQPFGPFPIMRPMYLAHRRSPSLSQPARFVYESLCQIAAELQPDVVDTGPPLPASASLK